MEVCFFALFLENSTQILLKQNESPLWMGWGASDACTPKVRHHVVHRVEPLLGWQIEFLASHSFTGPPGLDKILRIRISGFKY